MSAKLRSEARASGWPDHVIRHMSVMYNDGTFTIHSHDDHRDTALDWEYGTPNRQPTAAIRRFANRQGEAERFLLNRAMRHVRNHR